MLIPERHGNSDDYRYGFNGKENDNNIKGTGNSVDFGARMYDSRLGRWFATDPKFRKYSSWSTYNFVLNKPIIMFDPDGEDPIYGIVKGKVIWIGDDGKIDGYVYLVKGKIKRNVIKATSMHEVYKGPLSNRKKVVKIPTRGVLKEVVASVQDTEKSKRENGGHAFRDDNFATRWDEGPEPTIVYDEENSEYEIKASITPFKINTKKKKCRCSEY
jgi:RHS repeat-associated protein